MKINENIQTVADVIIYTASNAYGKLELVFSTYCDGSACDVMRGRYEYLTDNISVNETFKDVTISTVITTIQDVVRDRYLFITHAVESEHKEFIDYAHFFYFIGIVSEQLRKFQGFID